MFIIDGILIDLPDDVCIKMYDTIEKHIDAVRKFGEGIVPSNQLDIHDASKFSIEEFYGYARHFHGDRQDPNAFASAWLHHIHNNKHHWQYYIFPDNYHLKDSDMQGGIVRMSDVYVLEMLADWQAAGFVYTGNKDLSPWLTKNVPNIMLHTDSADFLRNELYYMGYKDLYDLKFKNEI